MPVPVVVKIGGSLITRRAVYKELDRGALDRLASEIARCERPLVVVHGAGGFGHVIAERHRLHEGSVPRTIERVKAFAQVHEDVRELDRLVCGALRSAGFATIAVSPLEVAHLHDGALDALDLAPFDRSLTLGFTPVTFGDAVHDDVRGWGILSGDVLAARIASGLGAELLVHATDVEGVFDRPPWEPGAALVPEMTAEEAGRASAGTAQGRADVTGGMAGKLRSAAEAARGGTDVLILDGRVAGRLGEALSGKDVPGTWIRATGGGR